MKNLIFYITIFIASCGGFLSGYDTGVISGALLFINKTFNPSHIQSGLIVSAVSVGAIIGAVANGILIDKIGRKKILIFAGFIFSVGSICCFMSQSLLHLILSRALLGMGVGITSFACPLYLSEISNKEKRGSIVSFYQLALTFGILFSYFINYMFSSNALSWRLMLGFGILPALILFCGMMFQSDTPRFYVLKNRIDEAKNILLKVQTKDPDKEIEEIKASISKENTNIQNDLKNLIKPFIIGIGIMFAQIVTGINAIIYYAPTIFKSVGFGSDKDVLFITIFIGLINFLMTFVAIAFVDKLGRKPLLYIGLSGMTTSLIVLSLVFISNIFIMKYLAVIFCAIYIVCFSMSLGPVALLIISEIFPLKYRGCAMSIAIISNFIFNFMVTFLFPISLNKIGGCPTFLIFALICLLSVLFIKFFVPETKGKTLEEIELSFKN